MFLLAVMAALSGCMNYSFGDLTYNDSEKKLVFEVNNNADEETITTIQITVFSLDDFRQKEYKQCVGTFNLKPGLNEYSFPVVLEKGNYKLYLYVLKDKTRKSAEIRDLTI